MTHSHTEHHGHVDSSGPGAGMLVALAVLIIAAIIGVAVLLSAPWDDDGDADTSPNVPIEQQDDVIPGDGGVDVPGDGGTNDGSGGTDGGSQEQPAQ